MDRRQEKIQTARHDEIVALLADVRQAVVDLFTGDIGDVNVAAYMLELQQERDTLQALLSDVIKERNELLDDLEAQVLHDTSDVEAALEEATRARLRNLLAWRAASLRADHAEAEIREANQAYYQRSREHQRVCDDRSVAYDKLWAAETAVERLKEELATEKALSEKLENDLDKALSMPPMLVAPVNPIPATSGGTSPEIRGGAVAIKPIKTSVPPQIFGVTPLAETVRELASRGHKAEGIHRIINQRSDPSAVINLAGIRAIYDMVVPK